MSPPVAPDRQQRFCNRCGSMEDHKGRVRRAHKPDKTPYTVWDCRACNRRRQAEFKARRRAAAEQAKEGKQ